MAGLPTGLVTLLLTEVVGSTARWEADADEMARATDALDVAVAEIVRAHDGHVVKPRGEGDAHFTVFAEPADAFAAAAALLRSQAGGLPIKVAVHTGAAELRGADYYGPAVNRCARLRAAAHAGQGVATSGAATAVGERLPLDLRLRALGTHFLKDLAHPEYPCQIVGDGLADEFPPLASLAAPSHGLPLPLNTLIGRDADVDAVEDALGAPGIVTVTGPPGVGKSACRARSGRPPPRAPWRGGRVARRCRRRARCAEGTPRVGRRHRPDTACHLSPATGDRSRAHRHPAAA